MPIELIFRFLSSFQFPWLILPHCLKLLAENVFANLRRVNKLWNLILRIEEELTVERVDFMLYFTLVRIYIPTVTTASLLYDVTTFWNYMNV